MEWRLPSRSRRSQKLESALGRCRRRHMRHALALPCPPCFRPPTNEKVEYIFLLEEFFSFYCCEMMTQHFPKCTRDTQNLSISRSSSLPWKSAEILFIFALKRECERTHTPLAALRPLRAHTTSHSISSFSGLVILHAVPRR